MADDQVQAEGRGALTKRQYEAYLAVRAFLVAYGYPPSVRDLGRMIGSTSRNYGFRVARILINRGWLRRNRNSRTLVPIDPILCPCCGAVVIKFGDRPDPPRPDRPDKEPPRPEPAPDLTAGLSIASKLFAEMGGEGDGEDEP